MARRRRWTEDERRNVLATYAESGLSLWAFAQAAGVPYTTLSRWRDRGEGTEAPRLVPVEIERTDDAALELVVCDVVVRVRGSIDDALLVRVVRALRSC